MEIDLSAPSEAQATLEWFRFAADAAPVMIWMSGTDKQSVYFNKCWLDFTGRPIQQELVTGWSEGLHPDDLDRCLGTYAAAFEARKGFEFECRQRRHDGEYRVVLGRGKPMHAPDGTFLGYVGSCIDVTERKRAEYDRERLLVEGIKDYAIYWLAPDGRVASWNANAEQLKGYRAEQIVGQHFSQFFPAEDVQAKKPDALLSVARAAGRVEDQGWRVREDRTRFWANVVITALYDDAGVLRGYANVTRDMTERKKVEDELVRYAQQLARLSNEQLQIVAQLDRLREQRDKIERERLLDDERKRIARDLHDGVVQAFFGIGLAATAALADGPTCASDQRLAAGLNRVHDLAIDGANQLREAIVALSDGPVTDRMVAPSLRKLAREFRERTGLEADVVVTGAGRRLPTSVAEALYATAREALSNVECHADARAVVLGLHFDRREVSLSVQDDGAGAASFVLHSVPSGPGHFGLGSVCQRVEDLNGCLAAGPNPDGGFQVRTRLPLTDTLDLNVRTASM